jgi:hypothetical protein
MKKVNLFFIKSLVMALFCFFIVSCDESGQEIPVYDMSLVSKYERGETSTFIFHDNRKITGYEVYQGLNESTLKYKAGVIYNTGSLYCTLDGINYLVQFDNTIGGSRVKELSASIGNALYYKVIYFYDDQGRLSSTEINVAHEGRSNAYYTRYEYSESSIKIIDDNIYEIQLGDEENTGYVFNVLSHSEAPLTSQYVFNPELYFLNIYGKPVEKLPQGIMVTRTSNSVRIGQHYYEYK